MATDPYLNLAAFKSLTLAPSTYVDQIEAAEAGWTLNQLVHWSGWINSQLRKRYVIPFTAPYPETVLTWLCAIVTWQVYLKSGIDTSGDPQIVLISEAASDARDQVKEAADARDGLFELPLRADDPTTAVSKGGPLMLSETSPYVWTTVQREIAVDEDSS